MFVEFAANAAIIKISQMIAADEDGNYDRLLDFVEAVTSNLYFIPSAALLDELAGD